MKKTTTLKAAINQIKALHARFLAHRTLQAIAAGAELTSEVSDVLSKAFSALQPEQISRVENITVLTEEQLISILSQSTLGETDRAETRLRYMEVKFYESFYRLRNKGR